MSGLAPALATTLFTAKKVENQTFASLGELLGRDEVAIAALFYGQARASPSDISALSQALRIPEEELAELAEGFPQRGEAMVMPPREPLIYRLYEIVQVYGQAYKAVLNEKFGDGIMSAVSFSSKVDKEVDEDGAEWAVITLRGKWLPFKRF